MYSFGSGVLFGTRNDIAGAPPINFGLVQEVTIEEAASVKELYGQFQHPVAIARGSVKTTGKAKVARLSGLAFGHLFYGIAPQAGQIATAFAEAGGVPAATPYNLSAANAAAYMADCGVIYAATGLPLVLVASAPAQGQYSVSAGIYTFAAADSGKGVLLNYTYALPASGQKIPVTNQLMGTTPTFSARFFTTFQNQAVNLTINMATSSKLSGLSTKLEDFVMPEFDFSCFADPGGNVLTWSFGEVS